MITRKQRALWNFTPVLHSMPVPGIDSILAEPLVCVTFSRALVPYLLGLLEIYRFPDKFSGTTDEILTALGVIQDLIVALTEGNCTMLDVRQNIETPCILEKTTDGETWIPFADLSLCRTPTRIYRYNPTTDGYESSSDGGTTWTPAPESDPRHVTTSPPHITDNTKCDAAASMVRFVSDTISSTTNGASIGLTSVDAAALILGLVGVFGPYAVFVLLALALFSIISAAGAEAVSAAMTSDTYDKLLCIFFCHVDENGFLTADALAAVNSDIDSQIGGLAATILHAVFLLTGEAGLNNAGATGLDTDDCSGCGCDGWCHTWDFTADDGGWVADTYGTWVAGQGWQVNPSPSAILFGINWTGANTLSRMTVEFSNGGGNGVMGAYNYDGSYHPLTSTEVMAAGDHIVDLFSGTTTVSTTNIYFNSNNDSGSTVYIRRITLYGDVEPSPFGEDNCP